MNRPRWWLVAPALLASAVLGVASAAEIRDKAGLFSEEAVKKAQAELDRYEREFKVPVTIETVATLGGESISELTTRHAEAVNADGAYFVIAKKEAKIRGEASSDYQKYLTRSRFQSVDDAFVAQFKKRDFDAGLTQGVAKIGSVLADAQSESGGAIRQAVKATNRKAGAVAPVRQAPVRKTSSGGFSLIWLILGVLAIFFVFRIIGAIFRAMSGNQYGGNAGMMGGRGGYPGPGGPGYGGGGYGGAPAGGGGFMSSLFGGIGGAMAGNYLYDQFSGRGHGGGVDQTGVETGAESAPIEDASPQWGGGGAEASWGDDAGTPDASTGGDWGGDAGGGDWGGGGDDNGGSW